VNQRNLADLAPSVAKHGLQQPVLVRPAEGAKIGQPLYELVAGERRWRACQMAGLDALPCLVRPMDDLEVIELMLVENLEREDLHPLDEAGGYDRLLRKDSGPQALRGFATVDALADRIGKSRSYVVQRLKLLTLCEKAELAFRENEISFSVALRIARLPDHGDQAKALQIALRGWGGDKLSARQLDAEIARKFHLDLGRATFNIADSALLPGAGPCRLCPKRAGNAPDLFGDDADADTCTDSICFNAKTDAHAAKLCADAEAKGMRVISGAEARKLKPSGYGDVKGLLPLDEVHHQLDSKKPLRKLLGKADVQAVMFQDPQTLRMVEMVPTDQAMAALKAAGVVKQAKMPSTSASQRAEDDKRTTENAWRGAAALACIQAAKAEPLDSDFGQHLVRRVAILLWHEMHNDSRTRLAKMLGWPPLKTRWGHGPGTTAEQHIGETITDGDLCAYLTAAVICADSRVGNNQSIGKAETLLAIAADLGVDAAALKAAGATPKRVAPANKAKPAETPQTALAGALEAAKAKPAKPALAAKKGPKGPAIKYRNAMTGETWTGRGLQPKWLKVALAGGKTLADFDTTTPQPAGAGTTTQRAPHA
jgi:ParB/RepB/Spo0J family partition protein